ncbi:PAS domain-containing protein [Patescibacteria group bacterium]|nr:MAG: PAS domain-containing protein [Patescibacteria group bacterium]
MSEKIPFSSRVSLQVKFFVPVFLFSTLFGIIFGSQVVKAVRGLIFERIKEVDGGRIKQTAEKVFPADYFSDNRQFYNISLFNDFSKQLRDNEIRQISVLDASGKVVFSDNEEMVGQTLSSNDFLVQAAGGKIAINNEKNGPVGSVYRIAGDSVRVYVPILMNGKGLPSGVVEIYYSLGNLQGYLVKVQWIIWLTVLIEFLIFFAVFVYFLRFLILRPVRQLNKAVSAGDLPDAGQKIRDEIFALTRSVVNMKQTVSKSSYALEMRVKERTRQLQNLADELEKEKMDYEKSNQELIETKRAVLNILEDVQEAKEEIGQEKNRLETILRSIGEGVYVVDADNKIVLFNRQAENLLVHKETDVLRVLAGEIFKIYNEKGELQAKNGQSPVDEIWRSGRADMVRGMELARKDGTRFPVIMSIAPILRRGEVAGGIVAFRDVTLEKEIDTMKSEFVSVASHQLRTPLSAIKWFLEMLIAGDAGAINENQKEFLDRAYESNERMIKLVNDLLNVSRMESGKIKFEPKPTQLGDIFQSVITELTPLTRARNITIQSAFADTKLPDVFVDPDKIRQVIMNLVSNAIKYTSGRGKIELFYERHPNELVFNIKDNGIGIPKDQQHKVFNKFFRADNVMKVQTEGSGLGLYIGRTIIEASGGRMWFSSQENKGTTFSFALPIHQQV